MVILLDETGNASNWLERVFSSVMGTIVSSQSCLMISLPECRDEYESPLARYLAIRLALLCLNRRAYSVVKRRRSVRARLVYSLTKLRMSRCCSKSETALSL